MRRLTAIIILSLSALVLNAQQEDIKFAFITDLHYSEGSKSGSDLRRCVADINTLDSLDFVMVGGDITDFGTDEEIAAAKSILDSLAYKYYIVPGNHDAKWSESGCNTFRKVFGYENFEFECKGWRFIGCSCGPDMRMAPALLPQESMEWLKGLKGGQKTIFVNHYPQDSSVLNYFDVTKELKRIGTRFEIGGHWHMNIALNYDGIPAVLGRSTLSAGANPGYNIVRIKDDVVTLSERRLVGGTTVLLEPWYSCRLDEVKDTVTYDSHGLPASYPWMRYDVNETCPFQPAWTVKENSNIVAGFARVKDRAWYTTASGCVRCISLSDGHRIWSEEFPGKIFSTPAVDGRYLVFGCTDGFIYALKASDGKLIWKKAADKSVLGSPVIRDGKVFIGSSDGVFRALALKDGRTVWEYPAVEGFVECRPYVDEHQVVFGTWANRLYSLNTADGSLQWIWNCTKPSRMYSPAAVWPVKSDGKIFIAVPDRRLYVLDAETGEEVKHFDGVARESVGISDDGSSVYVKSMWHRLMSVGSQDLEARWNVETGTGYDISPTSISCLGNEVIIPTDKGNIVGFRASDGERLWAYKIACGLVNPFCTWTDKSGTGFILASTMDGAVTLLEHTKKQ